MKKLLLLFVFLFTLPAHGQTTTGARYDGVVMDQTGKPVVGINVRVCISPAAGQPCTPLATIYSDINLSFPATNPTTTDFLGNFYFYVPSGTYELEFSGATLTTKQVPDVTITGPTTSGGGGNVTVSGTPAQFQVAVFSGPTSIGGVVPGIAGTCLISNGFAATPSFQACGTVGAFSPFVLAWPLIAAGANTIRSVPEYSDAFVQPGADACAQINTNWTAITSTISPYGGVNDARGFSGAQPCAASPLSNNTTLGGTLLLSGTQFQAASTWVAENGIIITGNAAHSVTAPVGGVRGAAIQAISTFPPNTPLLQIGSAVANTGTVSVRDLRVSMYPTTGSPSIVGGIGIQNLSGQEGTLLYNVIVDGACGDGVLWATSQAQNSGPIMGLSVVDDGCSAPGPSVQLGQAGGSQLIANTSMFQFSGNGFNALTQQPVCIALDFVANFSLESGHCEEQGIGIEIGANHVAHNISIRNYDFFGSAAAPMTSGIDIAPAGSNFGGGDDILVENIFSSITHLTNILNDRTATNPCTVVASVENQLGWYWRSQNSTFTSSKQCPDVWPAHNENFAASTIKIPTTPGCTASLTNMICYDSTAGNTHVLAGGVDLAIGSGSGNPCTAVPFSIQINNGGLFGCEPDLTFTSPHTLTLGAAGILTLTTGATVNGITAAMIPTLNQSTTGTAANLSGTPTLPNGTSALTQTAGDTTAKIATDSFVQSAAIPIGQFTNKNLGGNVSVTANTTTPIDSISLTMPSAGGPFRIVVNYNYFQSGGVEFDCYISDGTNSWGIDEGGAVGGHSSCTGSAASPVTYANGASVTITTYVYGNGSSTITTATTISGSSAPGSAMQTEVFRSN